MSCEKDLYENSIQNDSREIKVKSISIEDLQSNKEALKKLTDPKSRFKTSANSSNKALNDTINNFIIDVDNGLYIEVGNYNSYTFKINRPNGSDFLLENIIVSKKNETEYETFINQYNITEQELELIEKKEFVDLTGKINRIALESGVLNDYLSSKYYFNGSCYEDDFVYVAGQTCGGTGSQNHTFEEVMSGQYCSQFGTINGPSEGVWLLQTSLVDCDNTGGGDGPGGPTSGGHPGSGGSGSTYTGAVGSNPNDTKIKTFIKNLPPNVKQCYDSLAPQKKQKISSFLSSSLEALSDCPDSVANNDAPFNYVLELISSQCGTNAEEDWNDFENQFLTPSEGQDFLYNENFWNNPTLTFPQQNLPSYADYNNGMPRASDGTFMVGADNVYGLVGGEVLNIRNQYPSKTNNTCALKVSIALTRSGIIIPNIPGETIQGGGTEFSGKYFFLNARSLNA